MTNAVPGGIFLVEETKAEQIFTPEDFSEDHRSIADITKSFIEKEVTPRLERIESQDWDVTLSIMRKAGETGLLSIDIPESYGGLGLDKTSSMLVAEQLGKSGSFAATHLDHTGIGTLPVLYFGTEQQKQKYLPKFATGELLSSYSLTEPSSGSDALSLKTSAVLSEDKKFYILNGSKAFLTNAGLADVYITFAKVNGEQITAFILEKNTPGILLGKEEKKMGIKGSSTRTMTLEQVRVPVEQLLGEVGKGHKIAFNILNIGRFKLGACAIGGAKSVITDSLRYAVERKQFGKSISEFGLMKQKLGEMGIRTFVGESMVYRTAGLIDQALREIDPAGSGASEKILHGIEEYAVECSIIKVAASEILDYVVDEGVQIFGGYGFMEEYPVARPYRDSRINRIFEGTNEINRLLITDMLLKRAMQGRLPLLPAAQKAFQEMLEAEPPSVTSSSDPFGEEKHLLVLAKRIMLYSAAIAVKEYFTRMEEEQEVAAHVSDMVIEIYALESLLLRVEKRKSLGKNQEKTYRAILRAFAGGVLIRLENHAKEILSRVSQGDALKSSLLGLRKFLRQVPPWDGIGLRRIVADHLIQAGHYNL